MEEKDYELIEGYYRNALDHSELAEFRRRLEGDPVFRDAVQLHEDALGAIHLEGTAVLRARLAAKGQALDAGANKPGGHQIWWIVGLVAVLFSTWALWWWIQPKNPSPLAPVIENRGIAPDAKPDSVPSLSPSEKQSEPAPKTPNPQRVFAAWFQPYKDPSLEPTRRGDAERSPSERFQLLYWEGDYRAALAAFDAMGASAKSNDNLLFIKANCLLATGNAAEAGEILNNMLQNNRSRFRAQASWYLALSRLQTARIKEAETLLRHLAADPASPRRSDAERMLRDIQ